MAITVLSALALGSCQHAERSNGQLEFWTQDLRQIDFRHSEIVQSGDMKSLTALLHPAYAVHLPNGRIIDRDETLRIAKTGAFTREKHRREQQRVTVEGTTGIVMGIDHLETPPPLARRGERTRRYTNVYARVNGKWRLISRHFHFLP